MQILSKIGKSRLEIYICKENLVKTVIFPPKTEKLYSSPPSSPLGPIPSLLNTPGKFIFEIEKSLFVFVFNDLQPILFLYIHMPHCNICYGTVISNI